MQITSFLPDLRSLRAVLLRELRSAWLNRYLQSFAIFGILGGFATAATGGAEDASAFLLLQATLYGVSLFALLIGVSAAQSESEEWTLLFAQPVPRPLLLLGKLGTIWAILACVLALLFAPAWYASSSPATLGRLYAGATCLAALFASLGLWAGFRARDRAQALLVGIGVWLILLFGFDLAALLAAHYPGFQRNPDVWVSLLMLNPIDAFRIHALFALEQIPAETAGKNPLAAWWLAHAGIWSVCITSVWISGLLGVTGIRLVLSER